MGVSIQDRTDFLNMLDACRTEQQLFSRLTFAVMFHQTDPDAREDLLDDVRGALKPRADGRAPRGDRAALLRRMAQEAAA